MNRIEQLRQRALTHTPDREEFYYHFYKRYASSGIESEMLRYADALSAAFSALTPVIGDGELIVGAIHNRMTQEQRQEWEQVYQPIAKERRALAGDGQDSHMAIDYELLLSRGIHGILAQIEAYRINADREQAEFYSAARTCLLAVLTHAERYAACAELLAGREENGSRRQELLRIAEICRRVPAHPAETFYEAVQSAHFVTYCLSFNPLRLCSQQFQLGNPDRYLLSYYENDRKNGRITRKEAQLLLDCLGIQCNMRVRSGLSVGYMVGGRDEKGEVVANDLTEMLMQVVEDVRLVYPAVGLCYAPDLPRKYLEQACEILSRGRSHPAIFNDEVISAGLRTYGVPERESHRYIHSTCVEITPTGASNAWVASPYTNLPQLLLDTMTREYDSFEAHVSALITATDKRIEENFHEQVRERKARIERSLNPLLSCFVNDCLARGRDIEQGGARYNWIMPSFVGLANLADSLYAIKRVVYEERRYTVRGLKEILDANFEGQEDLRVHLLRDFPKYGNDVDEVDGYVERIASHIVSECKKYRAPLSEGRLIPSVFCWIMHEQFGRVTGATPDGRPAGFPLGDGSGPCQGREMKGPTASILSSTKWDHSEMIGGVAVNMKFSKSSLGEHSTDVMCALIEAFMRRGGFEMQINVIDRETLLRARECPREYSDLVVRIGGYSDYFTRLSSEMQEEVILRTEHRL